MNGEGQQGRKKLRSEPKEEITYTYRKELCEKLMPRKLLSNMSNEFRPQLFTRLQVINTEFHHNRSLNQRIVEGLDPQALCAHPYMRYSEVTLEFEEYSQQDNIGHSWSCSSSGAGIFPTSVFSQILQSFLSVQTVFIFEERTHWWKEICSGSFRYEHTVACTQHSVHQKLLPHQKTTQTIL